MHRHHPRVRGPAFVLAALLGLAVAAVTPWAVTAQAADDPSFTLDAADSYTPVLTGNSVAFTIPVTINAAGSTVTGAPGKLVGIDDAARTTVEAKFRTALAGDAAHPVVTVTIDGPDAAYPPPATYHLQITLDGTDPKGVASHSATTIDIVIPTAVLAITPALEATQTVTCPFELFCWFGVDTEVEPLQIRETSGQASAGGAAIAIDDRTAPSGAPSSYQVTLDPTGAIAAGGSVSGVLDVSGDYRTGTTKLALRVTASGATGAATTSLSIDRHQSGLLYLGIIGLGLVAGTFVRNWIRARIAKGTLEQSYRLRRIELATEATSATDPATRQELLDAIRNLDDAFLDETDWAAGLTKAVETSRSAQTAAADHQSEREHAATTRRGALVAAIERARSNPTLASAADVALALVPNVDEALARHAPSEALTRLDSVEQKALVHLREAAVGWTAAVATAAEELQRTRHAELPADLGEQISFAAASGHSAAVEHAPDLRALLDAFDDAHESADELHRYLGDLDQLVNDVIARVNDAESRLAPLEGALVEARGRLDEVAGVTAAWQVALQIADALVEVLREADDKHLASDLIDQAKYRDALDKIAPDVKVRFVEGVAYVDGAAPGEVAPPTRTATTASPQLPSPVPAPPSGPPPAPAGRTSKQLTVTLRVALGALGVLVLLGTAWVVLPTAIAGTAVQQIGVLLWAIAIVPTYDGLAAAATTIAPGPR